MPDETISEIMDKVESRKSRIDDMADEFHSLAVQIDAYASPEMRIASAYLDSAILALGAVSEMLLSCSIQLETYVDGG